MRYWIIAVALILSYTAYAMWAGPGPFPVCGSGCVSQMNYWGRPQFFPPYYAYAYPMNPSPYAFYQNPSMGPWQTLPAWNLNYGIPRNYMRGVATDNKAEKK